MTFPLCASLLKLYFIVLTCQIQPKYEIIYMADRNNPLSSAREADVESIVSLE